MTRIPPVRRLLMDAKALIAKPESWCKERDAVDAKSRWVGPSSPTARRFCADGAMQRIAAGDGRRLEQARKVARASIGKRGVWLNKFNDAPSTTHPMVMRLFNKGIRRAKEQGI